jgi:hypothetical protein
VIVTLGKIIEASKSNDLLGITDRAKIIDYIARAIEIAEYKTNWNSKMGTIDVCCDEHGIVTLPSFVEVPLAVNVGGYPARFHNDWFQYHLNGPGSHAGCGGASHFSWEDEQFTPVIQDLNGWKWLAAITEDPRDGDGSKSLIVEGLTNRFTNSGWNEQVAFTPGVGTAPSTPGVTIPLLTCTASTDQQITPFKWIFGITKPKTFGFIKLIGISDKQAGTGVTLGYYAPNETNPRYRRIKVSAKCKWVRIKYRRTTQPLENDYDVLPLSSYQAILDLLKCIRLRETNNIDIAEQYEAKAVQLLTEIQLTEDGPDFGPIQVDPSFGVGTIDYR